MKFFREAIIQAIPEKSRPPIEDIIATQMKLEEI